MPYQPLKPLTASGRDVVRRMRVLADPRTEDFSYRLRLAAQTRRLAKRCLMSRAADMDFWRQTVTKGDVAKDIYRKWQKLLKELDE